MIRSTTDLTIAGDDEKEVASLDADACADVYFAVVVTAETQAIDSNRDFTISAVSDTLTTELTGTLSISLT